MQQFSRHYVEYWQNLFTGFIRHQLFLHQQSAIDCPDLKHKQCGIEVELSHLPLPYLGIQCVCVERSRQRTNVLHLTVKTVAKCASGKLRPLTAEPPVTVVVGTLAVQVCWASSPC